MGIDIDLQGVDLISGFIYNKEVRIGGNQTWRPTVLDVLEELRFHCLELSMMI